eukprot:1765946-Rhodomonas_salina.2
MAEEVAPPMVLRDVRVCCYQINAKALENPSIDPGMAAVVLTPRTNSGRVAIPGRVLVVVTSQYAW